MGVKGLQTYVEKCTTAFREVDIKQMVNDYKKIHPDKEPIIVIDGKNCIQSWIGHVEWTCGGQWDEYIKSLTNFVSAFDKIGVKLVFFFDSIAPQNKQKEWLMRRSENIKGYISVFEMIKASKPLMPENYVFPAGLSQAVYVALKHICKATVYSNVHGECDCTIASFAAQNQCMAILAQDTDYIIYPTVSYISTDHLNLETMQTRLYCRETLCKELGLKYIWMLPLFACLIGTDLVSRPCLAHFHTWVCKNYGGFARARHNRNDIIACVAKYIASRGITSHTDLRKKVPDLYKVVHPREMSLDAFQKALDVYCFIPSEANGYIYPQDTTVQEKKNFYDVLLTKTINAEITPTTYNVIFHGRVQQPPCFEDVNATIKMPLAVLVFRPIRARMYGLMFELKEKYFDASILSHEGQILPESNSVDEWWINPLQPHEKHENVAPLPVVGLPDGTSSATVLHDILMENDGGRLLDKQWEVFFACMGISTSCRSFQHIPNQYKALCAILNYLIVMPDVPIKLWEIEAFLIQAVHPKARNSQSSNRQLQLEPYNSRALHLAALFLRGAEVLLDLLLFCNKPYGIEYVLPWNYFDGNLFHFCYKEMDKGVSGPLKILENNKTAYEEFQNLKDATFEGTDKNQ